MSNFFYTADGRKVNLENFGDVPAPQVQASSVQPSVLPVPTGPDESLRLKGNLSLDGTIRAGKYLMADGSEMKTIVNERKVLALPEKVTFDAQGNMKTEGAVAATGFTAGGGQNINKYSLDDNKINTIGSEAWWTVFRQHSNEGWKFNDEKNQSMVVLKSGSGDMDVKGRVKVPVMQLGDKFRLSGVGDGHGNDDWLRVFNKDNNGYFGGVAAGKLYAVGQNEGDVVLARSKLCVADKCVDKNTFNAGGAGGAGGPTPTVTVVGGAPPNIQGPNGQLRMTNQGIMFGGPNNGKEVNSGQISAGLHIPNSLNIVGMSSGPGHQDRRVDMWAEGGFNVYGRLKVDSIQLGDTLLVPAEGGGLRIQSKSGWVDVGSKNGGWGHIYTDRPAFAFNKPVVDIAGEGGYAQYRRVDREGKAKRNGEFLDA